MAGRPSLDPQRQAQARVYSRLRRRVGLLEMALGLGYLLLWLVNGAAGQLAGRGSPTFLPQWPVSLVLTAPCLGVPWFLIPLPLGYYAGFHLPHRFGQSTQTIGGWVIHPGKRLPVGVCRGVPHPVGVYALSGA